MSNQDLTHLFTPGDGGVPPYLAGRKKEQVQFEKFAQLLLSNRAPARNMIVYGPRGNGKTALLRYLQKETLQKEKTKLDIMWVKPFELETQAGLENLITGNDRKSWGKVKTVEFSTNIGIAGASVELDYSGPAVTLINLLRFRSQIKPLILIIDEAHTLKPEVGKVLLNISQDLRSEGNPFLLVLAGTPNLRATLAKTNASFWDRSQLFPLGRLSPEETRQALTVPLEKAGVSFAPGVVEEIVERTHCYPYFIQIWGDCVARRLDQTGETEVTMDTVHESEDDVHRNRNGMYITRYREFENRDLLPVAEEIARAFVENPGKKIRERELSRLIGKALQDNGASPIPGSVIMQTIDTLAGLGYIWETVSAESIDYEPGIPSLMSFVQRYSLPQTREEAAGKYV